MIKIKAIVPSDYPTLLSLLHEFAKFEKSMGAVTNSVELMTKETEHINGFMAEVDNKIVGYTTYFFPYHTWVGKCLHMDDLFVREAYRGRGIGKMLMKAVLDLGVKENCKRLRWQVSDWNIEAQKFYKNMGASIQNIEYDCEIILNQ